MHSNNHRVVRLEREFQPRSLEAIVRAMTMEELEAAIVELREMVAAAAGNEQANDPNNVATKKQDSI